MEIKAVIFDLDGVLVHTDNYHFKAWKKVSDKLGMTFTEEMNNQLRGVSRMESLEIILRENSMELSDSEKDEITYEKNEIYKSLLQELSSKDLDPGVLSTLNELKSRGIKLAIGSSSKNAPFILERLGIYDMFDTISDGNTIKKSKPDPEVFLNASNALCVNPKNCLVVEDAEAGIDAGKSGGFYTAGISDAYDYVKTDYKIKKLESILTIIN